MNFRIVKPSDFVLFDDTNFVGWLRRIYGEIKYILDAKDLPFHEVTLVWRDQITSGNNLLGLYINMSIDYISNTSTDKARCLAEAQGVIIHEFTKVFVNLQASGIPDYVVTGIADYVRLKLGYAPSHWSTERDENWKKGFASTAKFFQHLEVTNNKFVSKFYSLLCTEKYSDDFFKKLTGKNVEQLHCIYSGYSYDYVTWNEQEYETTCLVINKSASTVFTTIITSPAMTLREILIESMKFLYPAKKYPMIFNLTLYVRDMDGVAYTTSSTEPYTSEIHLNSKYLDSYNSKHNSMDMVTVD